MTDATSSGPAEKDGAGLTHHHLHRKESGGWIDPLTLPSSVTRCFRTLELILTQTHHRHFLFFNMYYNYFKNI